jgi:hypothetical protein
VHFSVSLFNFLFPSCAADALSAAKAHISSLEAELKASRKAFDTAATAKTTADKSTKSALAKAKKAEKALADANQGRIQREQAIIERLNKISALAGGKYHAFPIFFGLPILILLSYFLSLSPLFFRTYWGVFGALAAKR